MKKKKGLATLLLIIFISIIVLLINNSEKESKETKKEIVTKTNMLTMMLETEAGTGNYEEVTQSEWPTDGYVFNTELSKCENGGTLTWDDENKKVVMQSNTGDKCYVYFDKYEPIILAVNITKDQHSITINIAENTFIQKYYYSKDNGKNYIESNNNNFIFDNLNSSTKYIIKIYAIDIKGKKTQEYSFNVTTTAILADYIKNEVYVSDGTNGLYYHDGVGTYSNANQEARDKSYRYSGANPNNYVCFGSDAAICPDDNLYRIIGLFDDDSNGIYNVKLIKSTNYRNYAWDSEPINTWSSAEKPDIYTTLNTTYWETLSSVWQNKVDQTHQWQVGGMDRNTTYTAKQFYKVEVGTGQTGYVETMAVGLMYVSDYGYAASPENWQTILYEYRNSTNTNNNWLYYGKTEWTISRDATYPKYVYSLYNSGFVSTCSASIGLPIRPSFYLKSEVTFEGGTGSASDPFRVTE